jgi:predicted PurR-regulated permease PerM
MKNKNILHFYLISIIIFFCIYITWDLIKPFLSGFLLAYLLLPIYNFLYKHTQNTTLSAILVMILVVITIIILSLFFFQFIYTEFLDILYQMPMNTQKLFEFLGIKTDLGINNVFEDLNKNFSFQSVLSKIISYFFLLLYKILRGNFKILLEIFSFVFITPVFTVFFLINMYKIDYIITPLLPSYIYIEMKHFVYAMNKTMHNFLYGHFLVMIFQIIFYWILLSNLYITRVKFFIFIIALSSFIPSFGSMCGLFSFIIVSFIENTDLYQGLFVFLLGYIYENYCLIPYFIGSSLRISSFFIWCSVLIGGKVLGIIGLIFAIPVGTVIFDFIYKRHKLLK